MVNIQQVQVNSRIDPSGQSPLPVLWLGNNTAPATGIWKGYAVSSATGAVGVQGVTLGIATAAGQAFAFLLGVSYNDTGSLTNCTISGGMITES